MTFFGPDIRNGLPIGLGSVAGFGARGYSPNVLFAAGEQGVWYDPSDLSAMYQDSAGTTPVTAVEQAVGLILDKSKGLVLQDNIVVNGDFTSSTGWVRPGNWAISGGTANATGAGYIYRTLTALAGTRVFRVEFEVTAYTSGTVQAYVHNGSSAVFTAAANAPGKYSQLIVHSGVNELGFLANTFTGSVDNLVIRELAGNHAIQPSAASRPILRARYNLLTYSEQFDNAAWTKLNSSITQNAITAPDGTTTADKLIENALAGVAHQAYQSPTVIASTSYTMSVYAKAAERGWIAIDLVHSGVSNNVSYFDISTGALGSSAAGNSATITSVGDGWYRCTVTRTMAAGQTGLPIGIFLATGNGVIVYTGDGTSGAHIWGADLRRSSDTYLPYQRIAAATDYATVGFPVYLAFDGSDDLMYTSSIDFSATDKMSVFAGAVKRVDSPGMLVELSSRTDTNVGTFNFQLGEATTYGAVTAMGSQVHGTSGTAAGYTPINSIPSARTAVFTGGWDLSGTTFSTAFPTRRVNGSQLVVDADNAVNPSGGMFGTYPLQVGGRSGWVVYFDGNIHQLIVRGAQTSPALITQTERWIAAKQGRAL